MHLIRIRILKEASVLILVIGHLDVLKLTHQVWKVVIHAVRVTRLTVLAKVVDVRLLSYGVKLQDQAEKRDRHEQEADESRELVQTHLLWQMCLLVAKRGNMTRINLRYLHKLGEVVVVLQVCLKGGNSTVRVLTATYVGPLL
jgi:hypothetical protein